MFVVGLVNYKTSVYMETQFKIYRDFAGEDFQIIVIENSHNQQELDRIVEIAQAFAIPIRVILGNTEGYSSESHGSALNKAYKVSVDEYPNVPYLLTQDPDFFWVRPHFLTFLKEKLQHSWVVGAPYPETDGHFQGPKDFPAAFGAAYQADKLREIGADFRYTPGPPISQDVGWQIRANLGYGPYFSFAQEEFVPQGMYSFATPRHSSSSKMCNTPRRYCADNRTVGYHLFFGSFETTVSRGIHLSRGRASKNRRQKLYDMMPPEEWQENRRKLCEFFWKEINSAAKQ